MKIVCGLGNPGQSYAANRHNIGFMVVDELARRWKASFGTTKFDAELATHSVGGEKVLLLKPQTYMNLSGTSLGAAARFYKVPPAEVLVVHDELDLPYGRVQLKSGGGTGGHNGLSSIREAWGEETYARLRFGIGKPQGPNAKERVIGHVLGDFSPEERGALAEHLERSVQICEAFCRDGLQKAMNAFNRRPGDR